jgi:uncharacterized membrane protein
MDTYILSKFLSLDMEWLVLALLSYLFYSISTSIDKHLMNHKSGPIKTNAWKMFFNGTVLLIIGFLFFEIQFEMNLLFWGAFVGFIYAASGITYFSALESKNVNVVIPVIQSSILFVFLFGVLLLRETVDVVDGIAVVLIFLGAYSVVSNKKLELPKLDSGLVLLFWMVLFASLWAIVTKFALNETSAIGLAITMYFFSSFFTFVYSGLNKSKRKVELPKIAVSAVFGSIGTLFLYLSLAIENASKVYPISGIQSVFIFLIATMFLREKFGWNTIIGTLLVVIGIYLLA